MTDLSKRVNSMGEGGEHQSGKNKCWVEICALKDLSYDAGVPALLNENTSGETQLALFLATDCGRVYAIDNRDPFSDANVLARGIVCSIGDELAVASPVHKEHFSLSTGRCFEDDTVAVAIYPTKIDQERVFVYANLVKPAGEGQ